MALKPWYTVAVPREDLREGRPLDAAEFAVHLDKVRDGTAPVVYQQPQQFFERTYLTQNLTALAAEVLRRLSGERTETSAVFNLATQFGGGKTHALTLLYHLATHSHAAREWPGVPALLVQAGVETVPSAAVAVFVGTEFDSLTGRGGSDGTPLRKTPWGEIAYQLRVEAGLALVAEHEQRMIAPGGDVIRQLLLSDRPCLILLDELLNYVSRNRRSGLSTQLYDFIQNLSETARGLDRVVLAVSIPASELEMTPEDHSDHERFKKLLDRVGKAYLLSGETETSEIIRRRLFEWNLRVVGQNGRVSLPKEARTACGEYAQWVSTHRQQLPQWFPMDLAREVFEATYPFHPLVLSVFERKWRTLPRFQQTRGVLRLLALWVARAYQEGYKGAHKDPLIGLGTAPLDETLFRAAVFEQLGEMRMEAVVTTDICGKAESHATRLDTEASELIRKARLHRKVATAIFFESNGGTASRTEATIPEARLAVAEPELDLGDVETALEALASTCYYLTVEQNRYRFSLTPNLNKLLADRLASIPQRAIDERMREEIIQIFKMSSGVERIYFPERSNDIPDRPVLTLVVVPPEVEVKEGNAAYQHLDAMTRTAGASARTFKNALIWCLPDGSGNLAEEARKVLAWEAIQAEQDALHLTDEAQRRQLAESLARAKRDLQAAVWRSYRRLLLLSKDKLLKVLDLGQMNASGGPLVSQILSQLQQRDELVEKVGAAFLVRNWPPALPEWSTRQVRDAFYASPQLRRLLRADILKETVARGVSEGVLAYAGKMDSGTYDPFYFNQPLQAGNVELSDEMYILTAETAQAYLQRREQQQALAAAPMGAHPSGAVEAPLVYPTVAPASERVAEQPEHAPTPAHTAAVATILPGKLLWSGEIPPQKWTTFYMKVLTSLVNAGDLSLKVTLEASLKDGLTAQRLEAIKAALRELGLSDRIETE